MDLRTCLIVGAGIAGLTAARTLTAAGWTVTVVEKSRGLGGRMATRRIAEARFDHGAQFVTARDERFKETIREWEVGGAARPWFEDNGHVRYCGVDGITDLPGYQARNLDVKTGMLIAHIEPEDDYWVARSETGQVFRAEVLILTAPAEQSLALCEPFRPLLGRKTTGTLQSIHFNPCYALMALFEGPGVVPAPGYVRPEGTPILWIADNVQKGISSGRTALTLHADPRFTMEHWDDTPAVVTALMLEAAAGFVAGPVVTSELCRWRYSSPVRTEERRFLSSRCPLPVFFAGDAFGGPNVEGAFLSGLEAAEKLLSGDC